MDTTLVGGARAAAPHDDARRAFVLAYVQPGLAGLIDGSVSTLAPIFAAAFATHSNGATFLVGLAASLGAGISMGFTEALSDDGRVTGRGSPWTRGLVCGAATALGGLGHTLPYAIPDSWLRDSWLRDSWLRDSWLRDSWANAFGLATGLALLVVAIELAAIAAIRARYMATPFARAVLQIVLGGALVLAVGVLIGSA